MKKIMITIIMIVIIKSNSNNIAGASSAAVPYAFFVPHIISSYSFLSFK